MGCPRRNAGCCARLRSLSIVLGFTMALVPVCGVEAQSSDQSLWQDLTSPYALMVAPAASDYLLLPWEGEHVWPAQTLEVVPLPTAVPQITQPALVGIRTLRNTGTLTAVLAGVAGGLIAGPAIYEGVRSIRSNHKIKRQALLAQREFVAERQLLMRQRQALNEQVAEAAEAAWHADVMTANEEMVVSPEQSLHE